MPNEVIQKINNIFGRENTAEVLPSLSLRGWLTGTNEKIDAQFAWYMINEPHQSLYHHEHVVSLPATIQKYYTNMVALCDKVRQDLTFLLSKIVDHADIHVTYKEHPEDNSYELIIQMDIIHQGHKWTQFKNLEMKDSKFELIANINRSGYTLGD